jgi:hypothetical protein
MADGSRADYVFARLQSGCQGRDLEQFVQAEAESDQRSRCSRPRHHGPLVGEASALKGQLLRG